MQWPGKKIKLKEEAISEILVADTDSESGSEDSDFADYLEGWEEEENPQQQQQQQQKQASAEVETQAATSGRYQPGDHLKEGTEIFILLSVQQNL